mmetsp:Transcript_30656/g.89543  ORF Transcript_30656/g.89543 Transcript_30656/m.89543 type:complete len:203 (+) Transcript_30656:16-624(+)|eukprot:CAMPEP_0181031380 /NCGR_PEP_ID=MMETSP1070-20121207/6203_1 /TAXON_ID=265543 /ORGANISM="Minutocellus polymorphus, Strain NH13" /LENGTH=202 /DNA_ID=CAMNT_0023108757 /DNA_START=16 /DNA_END=624 /DNA_ORIENTATION=+
MKTAACLSLALAGSAAAFAPAAQSGVRSASVATNAVWDEMYGGVDFRGKEFKYDPLNLAESYKPFLPWFREAELKHGRTAMLAVMGFIATDFVRIPGDMYSFEAIPRTIDAHDALLKTGPMYQLLFWVGFIDILVTAPAVVASFEGEREPGDFAFGTKFAPKDDAGMQKKKVAELLNGRLAMIAVGGIATQSIITGHGFPYI